MRLSLIFTLITKNLKLSIPCLLRDGRSESWWTKNPTQVDFSIKDILMIYVPGLKQEEMAKLFSVQSLRDRIQAIFYLASLLFYVGQVVGKVVRDPSLGLSHFIKCITSQPPGCLSQNAQGIFNYAPPIFSMCHLSMSSLDYPPNTYHIHPPN